MVVGIARFELHIPESRSLKSKRQVLRSLKERARARFPVSIAEVDHQDLWQRATIGVAVVGGEQHFVEEVLQAVRRLVEEEGRLAVLDYYQELV